MTGGGAALASEVIAARRAMGLTPAGLSDRSGVAVAVVERIEHGDVVAVPDAKAVLRAVGMDPAPVLGGIPHGPVPVPPVDAAHAKAMAYLSATVRVDDGWLVFPDAAAVPPLPAPSDDEVSAAVAARDGWSSRGATLSSWGGFAWWASSLPLLGTMFWSLSTPHDATTVLGLLAEDPRFDAFAALLGVWAASGLAVIAGAGWDEGASNPHVGHVEALEAALDAARARDALVRSLAGQAYELRPDGITAHRVRRKGLSRDDFHVTSFESVDVRDEDAGHVAVKVSTIVGRVEMRWLPRTHDLLALVEAWRARTGAPMDGPQ